MSQIPELLTNGSYQCSRHDLHEAARHSYYL